MKWAHRPVLPRKAVFCGVRGSIDSCIVRPPIPDGWAMEELATRRSAGEHSSCDAPTFTDRRPGGMVITAHL